MGKEITAKDLQVGDILIHVPGKGLMDFGHVMMVYEPNAKNTNKIQVIHATGHLNGFLKDDNQQKDGNTYYYLVRGVNVHRPPWHKVNDDYVEEKKRDLLAVADAIGKSATYGVYRAMRLKIGDCKFGADARSRLEKYDTRLRCQEELVVSKVTCAEAVVLTYQLTFGEAMGEFFIEADAAHIMPGTLDELLTKVWGKPDWIPR